jgi:hypothetical protein
MATKNRHKGNRIGEGFIALPYSVLNSPLLITLSPRAVKLLIDVAAQYRGDNNGDRTGRGTVMFPRSTAGGTRAEEKQERAKRTIGTAHG